MRKVIHAGELAVVKQSGGWTNFYSGNYCGPIFKTATAACQYAEEQYTVGAWQRRGGMYIAVPMKIKKKYRSIDDA